MILKILALAVTLLLGACGGGGDEPEDRPPPKNYPPIDCSVRGPTRSAACA